MLRTAANVTGTITAATLLDARSGRQSG
jgi:hypothetical protein